jgi:hypothetical protein
MGQQTHNINIVWQNTGLDAVSSASNNFAKTSTTVAKSQDQVATSLTKTQGAAVKTGKEYTNVSKAATNTSKSTGTLGKAFKSSSLQISAFASSLTSSYIQIDSLMDQEMKLNRMRKQLDSQTTTLAIKELNLKKRYDEGKISGEAYRLASEKLAAQRGVLAVKEEQYADAIQDNKAAWVSLATTVLPTVLTGFSSLSQIIGTVRGAQTAAKSSTDLLSTGVTGLGTATTTTTTKGITPLITGLKNFVLGGKDTTTVLGTKTNGLVGGVSALNLGFTDTEKSGNIFIRTFKNLGTSVKDFFSRIKTDIGGATGIVDKIKAGFSSFFTSVGTGFKGLGGHLKTAGAAFVSFGKTLLGVFMSNPILLVIGAIATAVAALVFDLGGFRTRLNEIGVAIGNAVPGLKPLLDGLGWFGEQLGNVGNMLMGTQKEMTNTADSAAMLALKMDPSIIALQKFVDVGSNFEKLDAAVKMFDVMREAVGHLGEAAVKHSTVWQSELGKVTTAWTSIKNTIKDASPQTQAAIAAIDKTLKLYADDTITAKEAQTLLGGQMKYLSQTVGGTIAAETKLIETQQEATEASTGLSDGALAVVEAMQQEAGASDETAVALDKNQQAVKGLLDQYGAAIPAAEDMTTQQVNFLNALDEASPLLEEYADKLQINADGTINWGATIQQVTKDHDALSQRAGEIWNDIYNLIQSKGIAGYKDAISYIELVTAASKEEGAVAQKALDDIMAKREESNKSLSDMIDTALKGADAQETAEQKIQKALADSQKSIDEKATALKIFNDIQGLSMKDQETAIKITEDQNQANDVSRQTLQQLAVARGADLSQLKLGSKELLNIIQTRKLEKKTMDDVYAATGQMIDARQQDKQAIAVEHMAAELFLKTLNQTAPVIGMTGKGLLQLSKTYDETAKASQIAADEVGNWIAQLEKEEAIEQATLKTLQDYAKAHQIEIPKAIEDDIDKTKEYIQIVEGIGPAAKKATDEAKKAFDGLVNDASSAMENLIQEDVIKGDMDDVIEKMEEVGSSLDTLSGKKAIIDIFLNDDDFTNDLQGLPEILNTEMAEMEMAAAGGGQGIVDALTSGMIEHLGSEAQPVVDHVNKIWAQIQASNAPGTAGSTLIQQLLQALNQPSLMTAAGQKLGSAVPPGVQSGLSGLPGVIKAPLQQGLQAIFGQGAQFGSAGQKLGTSTTQGAATGLQNGKSTVQNATLAGINQPITSTIGQVPGAAGTALAPVEGVFSTAFLAASIAATGQINMLLADITLSMGFLVTNVGAKLTEIQTAWTTHVSQVQTIVNGFTPIFNTLQTSVGTAMTAMTTSIGAWVKASTTSMGAFASGSVKVVQGALSTLSTSTKTYMTSMTSAVSGFAKSAGTSMGQVGNTATGAQGKLSTMSKSVSTYMSSMSSAVSKFASAFSSAMSKVSSQAAAATSKVKALQSAVNSLKSKSINIHVGLSGPGAAYLKTGGAFISPEPTGFAQGGKSWINSKPRKIGGVNISEFGKPELVTVTPLSNPMDPTDKNINMNIPVPKPQAIPHMKSGINTGGGVTGGAGGHNQPINVELHTTIAMPDGKVLAKAVQQHLLSGFSGIT